MNDGLSNSDIPVWICVMLCHYFRRNLLGTLESSASQIKAKIRMTLARTFGVSLAKMAGGQMFWMSWKMNEDSDDGSDGDRELWLDSVVA